MTRYPFLDELRQQHDILRWDVEYWYSYVVQGLHNEIRGHTRKDQRTYQRHFCNCLSKLDRFREQHAELFI